mgnify:CR=1 FL=1
MNRYEQLYSVLMSVQDDFRKFYEGNNKAAGTRVRKGMLELRKISQDIRKEVQDIKHAM